MDRLVGIEPEPVPISLGHSTNLIDVQSPITATLTHEQSILKGSLRLMLVDSERGEEVSSWGDGTNRELKWSSWTITIIGILDRGDQKEGKQWMGISLQVDLVLPRTSSVVSEPGLEKGKRQQLSNIVTFPLVDGPRSGEAITSKTNRETHRLTSPAAGSPSG